MAGDYFRTPVVFIFHTGWVTVCFTSLPPVGGSSVNLARIKYKKKKNMFRITVLKMFVQSILWCYQYVTLKVVLLLRSS